MSSEEAWRDMSSATSPSEYTQAKNDYYLAKNTEDGWAKTQEQSTPSSGFGWDSSSYSSGGAVTYSGGYSGSGSSGVVSGYQWSSLWHTTVDAFDDLLTSFRHDSTFGWLLAPFQVVWYLVAGIVRIAWATLRLGLAICAVIVSVALTLVVVAVVVCVVGGIAYGLWTWYQHK